MRALSLCLVLVFTALPSVAQKSPTVHESLVAEFIRVLEPQLNRDLLSGLATASAQDMISTAAAQAVAGGGDSNSSVQRDLAMRAGLVYRNYFQSRAFIDEVLRPWVEATFSDAELEQLSAFVRSPAGAKFVRSTSRLPMELVGRASQQLQTEIANALFGANSDEKVRTSRIKTTSDRFEAIGGDVRAPEVISRVAPNYPIEARRARISGTVILETKIDEAGNVSDVSVLRGLSPSLDQSALDSVRQWRFRPATRSGVPVPVVFNLTINFKLDAPVN